MELDREDFRIHLVAKDPNEIVGERLLATQCPVANWLSERLGSPCSFLPWAGWQYIADEDVVSWNWNPAPPWANEFARRIDQSIERDITAKHALTILDGIDL